MAALKIEPLEQIATEEDWEKKEGFLRLVGRKSLLAGRSIVKSCPIGVV